jgi:hypothetical protein
MKEGTTNCFVDKSQFCMTPDKCTANNGVHESYQCPGGDDNVCCKPYGDKKNEGTVACAVDSEHVCMHKGKCDHLEGSTLKGQCPGDGSNLCCVLPESKHACKIDKEHLCMDTLQCKGVKGTSIKGQCGGGDDNQVSSVFSCRFLFFLVSFRPCFMCVPLCRCLPSRLLTLLPAMQSFNVQSFIHPFHQ